MPGVGTDPGEEGVEVRAHDPRVDELRAGALGLRVLMG